MAKQKAKKRHIANSILTLKTRTQFLNQLIQVRQVRLPQPKNLMYPDF